ncbi:MAG: prephenate dehydrogenase/arogenate dehydrogenase family protein [Candidatus Omnitrophota bacterium]|nr:MAG: prephenate dehydrogenase/arogenate dehydrogenase family protein [Candidatus Omnitrophota bacterium]
MGITFKKTVIVGPGLIGGAIGIAMLKRKISTEIVGIARHCETINKAIKKKAITSGQVCRLNAVKDADLVVLAVPVSAIKSTLKQIKYLLKKGCIVFDVGSTKKEIVDIAEKFLPQGVYFVGTHPMAGSEKKGVDYAKDDFFINSVCLITKTKKTNQRALDKVMILWQELGAATFILTPLKHDKITAQISHLTHLLSAVLVNSVTSNFLQFSGKGFLDTTRIASGNPQLWQDILFSNKKQVLKAVAIFEKNLAKIKNFLQQEDKKNFTRQLARAKKTRDMLCKRNL